MSTKDIKLETPANIEILRKMAAKKYSWRERLEAVKELSEYDCQQSRDILTRLAIHDKVFKVKEAAFRAAQSLNITKNGQPIRLTRKKKGNLIEGINKFLLKIHNQLESGYTLDEFKSKFKEANLEYYDTYEGDKGDNFDKWLTNCISTFPKKT